MTTIWSVQFGNNFDSVNVVAKTIDEAIRKARKARAPLPRGEDGQVSKVHIVAEAE